MRNVRCPAPIARIAGRIAPALLVAALLTPTARGQVTIKPNVPTVPFKVRLELKSKAALEDGQVRYALMPAGKRVGLSYTGVEDPETIAHYTKLGFKTSIAVSPGTGTERLKALEDAGADLTLICGVGPEMDLTPQECFDGATMRRVNVMRRCKGPVAIGPYNNMRNNFNLPTDRGMGRYLYAVHDSNYLACNSWATGYKVIVGRNRTPEQIVRPHNANSAGIAPNTMVYYQTVANILQGTVEMMSPGEVTSIQLRDFKEGDRKLVDQYIGQFGKDPRIWHTCQTEIAGYAYLQEKSRLLGVTAVGEAAIDINMAVEEDTYLPFCPAGITLKLPKDLPVAKARMGAAECPVTVTADGVFVDVPVRKGFAAGCEMALQMPENVTIPEDAPVTLTIKNTGDKPIADAKLAWLGNVGVKITGGADAPFTLAAGEEKKVEAVLHTERGERRGRKPLGARFGLTPVGAHVTGTVDGEERSFMATWEVLVAPRLRVEMDPRWVHIPKGDTFPIFIHLANGKVDSDSTWGKFSDRKLLDYRTGPCKGTVAFNLPEGTTTEPASQPFELKENDHLTLMFTVKNAKYGGSQEEYLRPAVRFAGEKDPIEVPWYGSAVMRDAAAAYEPLDKDGLLAYASWDDRKNTKANLDKASGSIIQHTGGATGGGSTPSADGVKNWCIGWESNVTFDAYRNIDYHKGTVMFYLRREPKVRNDIQVKANPSESWKVSSNSHNYGEKIFAAGPNRDLILRRFAKNGEQEGYLELVVTEMPVRGMPVRKHYLQAPYDSDKMYTWRHVAILWDMAAQRLELYLDGELAGRCDKSKEAWMMYPWDLGRTSHNLVLTETHHGNWSGTEKDEFYIYDRPLTQEQIKANMLLVKKAKE